jgi:hypothetical protein
LNHAKNIFYYLILSFIGAALIALIILFDSSTSTPASILEKSIVGAIFIIGSIFGISLAVRPNWLWRFMNHETLGYQNRHSYSNTINQGEKIKGRSKANRSRNRRGHHPVCISFKSHTIQIKDKILCAGCTGLIIGAVIGIFLMCVYIIYPNKVPITFFYVCIVIGMIIIAVNFSQTLLIMKIAGVHLISNTFLVIGFLLITIGIFQVTGKIIYGIVGVILSFLWLDTRVQLSKWRHECICSVCKENCKEF